MYLTHGMTKSPEYLAWRNLLTRCLNPNDPGYHRYGGRGIKICQRWLESFQNFFDDVGARPAKGYSLDRKNNDGNYEPSNCHWTTRKVQQQNTRRNVFLTHNGESLCIYEWSRRTGIHRNTILGRISRGWKSEDVLATRPMARGYVHRTARRSSTSQRQVA